MTHQGTAQDRRQVRYDQFYDAISCIHHDLQWYRGQMPTTDPGAQLRRYLVSESEAYYARFARHMVRDHTALELHMYEAYDTGQAEDLPHDVLDLIPDTITTITRDEFLLKPFLHTRTAYLNHADEAPILELLAGRAWRSTSDYRDVEYQENVSVALLVLLGALASRNRLFSVMHTLVAYHSKLVPLNASPMTYFTGDNLKSSLSMYLVTTYDTVQERMVETVRSQGLPVEWQSPFVMNKFINLVCDYSWFWEIMQDEYEVLVVENDPESPSII